MTGGTPGEFEIGAVVGQLRIERELGRGGFAVVYLARDTVLHRPVALKVLSFPSGSEPTAKQRDAFLAEARIVGGLNSANIVTLYSARETAGAGWIIEMEYVDGGSLDDAIHDSGPIPPRRAAEILRGILSGLRAAHDHGVLHRDIKPANVLLGHEGVKLADFGTALVLGDQSLEIHAEGMIVGTPWFIAPEVILGEEATTGSDLWSVGVLAYEMLTGQLPFPQSDLPGLFFALQNMSPAPLGDRVPQALEHLVMRCLAKRRQDRAARCEELLAYLDRSAATIRVADVSPAPVADRSLFGRDEEVRQIDDALDAARLGRTACVVVTGDAGIGKSALLAEVRLRAQQRGLVWLRTEASRVEGLLQSAIRCLREFFAKGTDLEPTDVERFGDASSYLGEFLHGEPTETVRSPAKLVWAFEHLLRGLSQDRAICLVIDDAHHAHTEDAIVCAELVRRLEGAPIVLIVASRPEGEAALAPLAELHDVTRIELAGLRRKDLYAFLCDRAGDMGVPPAVASHVSKLCDGNPLFAEQVLDHLLTTGAVREESGRYVAVEGWETQFPEHFHAVANQRLASLGDDERSLLEVAAVDGREFDGRALAAVTGEPLIAVLRRLQRSCRARGLIEPSEGGYRFRSSIVQTALYQGMAGELRAALHRALAEHLEERSDKILPERMARHWDRGGDHDRAVPYLLRAGWGAWRRQESRRVIRLAGRAGLLEDPLAPEMAARDADFTLHLARTLSQVGRTEDAKRVLGAIEAHARAANDEQLLLRTELFALILRRSHAEPRAGDREFLEHAVRECVDARARGEAEYILGLYAKRRGELEEARAHLTRANELFAGQGSDRLRSATLDQLGSVALRSGAYDVAEGFYRQAADLSAAIGRRGNAAASMVNLTVAATNRGTLKGADSTLEDAIRIFEIEGIPHHAAHARAALADVQYALGDLSRGLATVAAAIPELERTKHRYGLFGALQTLGTLQAASGFIYEAADALKRAEELAERLEEHGMLADLLAQRAELACFEGRPDLAAEFARASIGRKRSTAQSASAMVSSLAVAALFGLPIDVLDGIEGLIPIDDDTPDAAANRRTRALLGGVRALAIGAAPTGPLHAAADALTSAEACDTRANMRVVASWLRAEALRREGDASAACDEALRGVRAAKTLGHVWLEAALSLLLHRIAPESHARTLATQIVTRVAARLGADQQSDTLMKAWLR